MPKPFILQHMRRFMRSLMLPLSLLCILSLTGTLLNIMTGEAQVQANAIVEGTLQVPCGEAYITESTNVAGRNYLHGVAALSATDAWAVGWYGNGPLNTVAPRPLIEHWDGSQWSVVPEPDTGDASLTEVVAISSNNVWAVGATGPFFQQQNKALVLHWDGFKWTRVPLPDVGTKSYLEDIAATSATDIWAVGQADQQGLVLHWDGTQWSRITIPASGTDTYFYGIATLSINNVWVVGKTASGAIAMHWDGNQWLVVPVPASSSKDAMLRDVVSISASEAWAVGHTGEPGNFEPLIVRWNGSVWTQVSGPNLREQSNVLNGIEVVSGDSIWSVGVSGVGYEVKPLILRWNGNQWTEIIAPPVSAPLGVSVHDVEAISKADIWVVGAALYSIGTAPDQRTLAMHFADPCVAPTPLATATLEATPPPTRASSPLPPPVPLPGEQSATFSQTGKHVSGIFLDYWQINGGLAQQGYPISELMGEVSDLNGRAYTVQYFERAVFEYHPENQPPYDVLLSQLGTFQYRAKYGNDAPGQKPNTSAGSMLFPETGKRVGGRFLEYWQKNGGLRQQGYPISNEFTERSALDGKEYQVQYFERAVFEYHPENQPPYDVLLSQLGTFQYRAKYGGR